MASRREFICATAAAGVAAAAAGVVESKSRAGIDVDRVLSGVPHRETFCSVDTLNGLVESLRKDRRFTVETVGTSVGGVPIYHVRFGTGRVKALFVAFEHCPEPNGGLTVFSLMTLFREGHPELVNADVEWHVVPCIDPDGAKLNESWTTKPFDLGNFMRGFYLQPSASQVAWSLPIHYKKLAWDRPVPEARLLQGVLEKVRPDFYFDLHNSWPGGGVTYYLNRDIGERSYSQMHALRERLGIPMQARPSWKGPAKQFGAGMVELSSLMKQYDRAEAAGGPSPQSVMGAGANSTDYVALLNPNALIFIIEPPQLRHPDDGSREPTTQNLRQLKMRVDTECKFLLTQVLEEWPNVEAELDRNSPFFAKAAEAIRVARLKLGEGGSPLTATPTQTILTSASFSGMATRGDRFTLWLFDRLGMNLCMHYGFVRLLQSSPQTAAVQAAVQRLEKRFDEGLKDLEKEINAAAFEPIDCDSLSRVQLGSGLIALNTLLESPRNVV